MRIETSIDSQLCNTILGANVQAYAYSCACRLTSGVDFDFAEGEGDVKVVRSCDEEIASRRGLRVAVERGGAAKRQSAGVVDTGRALVHHRGLSGPRGHVGQSNGEVRALGGCKQVITIIIGFSFLVLDALPNGKSMAYI